jgi:hypothetical protein
VPNDDDDDDDEVYRSEKKVELFPFTELTDLFL